MKTTSQRFEAQGADSTQIHLTGWLDSIRTRREPYENALTGHRAAACAHMVNLAAKQRRQVEWDFEREEIRSA